MDEHLKVLESKLDQQVSRGREMVEMAQEQRRTLRERDIARFEEITASLAEKYQDFSRLQGEILDLWKRQRSFSQEYAEKSLSFFMESSTDPEHERMKGLFRELLKTVEAIHEENRLNLALINGSLHTVKHLKQILYPGGNVLYGGKGSLREDQQLNAVLNKTV